MALESRLTTTCSMRSRSAISGRCSRASTRMGWRSPWGCIRPRVSSRSALRSNSLGCSSTMPVSRIIGQITQLPSPRLSVPGASALRHWRTPRYGNSRGSASGSGGPSAARHVMLLLEPPRFAAVVRSLAAPNERIRPDVVERPTQEGPLVVVAAKHDAIVLGSPLHPDGDPEGWGRKHDGPLVSLGVHEPHPGDHLPLVGRAGLRVTEKNVLERVAVQDPSEQHLPARVANAAVLRDERVVGVPRAHKAPEQVRMVPQRRVRSLSRKNGDHIPAGIRAPRTRPRLVADALRAAEHSRAGRGGGHPAKQLTKTSHAIPPRCG